MNRGPTAQPATATPAMAIAANLRCAPLCRPGARGARASAGIDGR